MHHRTDADTLNTVLLVVSFMDQLPG